MGKVKHEGKTLMLLSNFRFIKTPTPHEPVGNIDYFNATLLRERVYGFCRVEKRVPTV
jgi:hypothetical protein